MADLNPRPLLINGSQETLLDRVPLDGSMASVPYSEQWLQDLLYRFPQALPTAEIDAAFAGMIPVCREMNTSAGPIDVLYVTPSGRLVLLEAKLWRNPESRRKVIGQILDYAKELSRWSYETLDAAVRAARRNESVDGTALSLYGLVKSKRPDTNERDFVDGVYRSLKRGDFLLLIAGDGIREGIGAITDFLEGHGTLHFTFGLVEMAIYQMPDGGRLVQPRVITQSSIVRRFVVTLMGDSLVAEETELASEAGSEAVTPELQQEREKFQSFWREFLDGLKLDNQAQPISEPARNTNQFFRMPSGSKSWVSAYLSQSTGSAGVYLRFARGAVGDEYYAALESRREEIDRELGIPVRWENDGEQRWISVSKKYPGELLTTHRAEVRALLADWINRFVTVFRARLEALVRERVRT